MAKRHTLSAEFIREAFSCDALTGKLFWKHRPIHHFATERSYKVFNSTYSGREAFTSDDGFGYRQGRLNNIALRAHVAAFVIMTGKWPAAEIDHINGQRSDNRWENLRAVTRSGNARNAARRKDNTSGSTGVVWHSQMNKWYARIGNVSLGLFDNIEDARAARMAAQDANGYSKRHGSVATSGKD